MGGRERKGEREGERKREREEGEMVQTAHGMIHLQKHTGARVVSRKREKMKHL